MKKIVLYLLLSVAFTTVQSRSLDTVQATAIQESFVNLSTMDVSIGCVIESRFVLVAGWILIWSPCLASA